MLYLLTAEEELDLRRKLYPPPRIDTPQSHLVVVGHLVDTLELLCCQGSVIQICEKVDENSPESLGAVMMRQQLFARIPTTTWKT